MPEENIPAQPVSETPAAEPVVKKEPFAALSEQQTVTVTKEPVVEPSVVAKEGEPGYVEPAKAELKEGDVGYVKPADAAPVVEPIAFKFADQLELGKDVSFQSLGTEYGFEVKENTPAAFNEGLKTYLETEKSKVSETSFLERLEKEPVAAQEAYLLVKAGYSLEEIAKPTQEIDALLSLSSFDLAKAELDTNKTLSASIKEAELQRLTESGELDEFANNIRGGLTERKKEITDWRTNNFNQLLEKERTRQTAESTQRLTSIEAELKNVKDFLGTPINEDIQKGFVQRLQAGKYNDLLNSPKAIAMAIMQQEMGQYAVNELKQKAIAPIIEKEIKEKFNVPPHQNTGNIVEQPKSNKPFSTLSTG